MRTYFETLDTNQLLPVRLVLTPILDNGAPKARVVVNGQVLLDEQLWVRTVLETEVPLLEGIEVQFTMTGKQYSATSETAVVIDQFSVDGIDIVPKYTHTLRYESERGEQPPTHYMGINGTISWSTGGVFYHWLHHADSQGWLLKPS